ncbi:hypothetical protein NQ318_008650 [Aromia moschata]|uniref:Dynein light chain n=1 Tax=Aromia moschata TaxID=1265417 RepID=A0AAV8XQ20_9CUCU|nr:hypothetical protein NQ318_008650 [Aromia moschata]
MGVDLELAQKTAQRLSKRYGDSFVAHKSYYCKLSDSDSIFGWNLKICSVKISVGQWNLVGSSTEVQSVSAGLNLSRFGNSVSTRVLHRLDFCYCIVLKILLARV